MNKKAMVCWPVSKVVTNWLLFLATSWLSFVISNPIQAQNESAVVGKFYSEMSSPVKAWCT